MDSQDRSEPCPLSRAQTMLLCMDHPKGARPPDSQRPPPKKYGGRGRGMSTFCPQAGRGLRVAWGGRGGGLGPGSFLWEPAESRRPASPAPARRGWRAWRGDCAAAWTRVSGPQGGTAGCAQDREPARPPGTAPPLLPSPRERTGERIHMSLYCRHPDFRRERKPGFPGDWPSGDMGRRSPSGKPRWRGVCPRQEAPEARPPETETRFPSLRPVAPRGPVLRISAFTVEIHGTT